MRKAGRDIHPDDLPPLLGWEREIWELYELVSTQWRVGMGGAVGLDYGPFIRLVDDKGFDLAFSLELLKAAEGKALEGMHKGDGGQSGQD